MKNKIGFLPYFFQNSIKHVKNVMHMIVGKRQFCSIIVFLCFITEEISGQGFNLVTRHLKLGNDFIIYISQNKEHICCGVRVRNVATGKQFFSTNHAGSGDFVSISRI